LKKKNH